MWCGRITYRNLPTPEWLSLMQLFCYVLTWWYRCFPHATQQTRVHRSSCIETSVTNSCISPSSNLWLWVERCLCILCYVQVQLLQHWHVGHGSTIMWSPQWPPPYGTMHRPNLCMHKIPTLQAKHCRESPAHTFLTDSADILIIAHSFEMELGELKACCYIADLANDRPKAQARFCGVRWLPWQEI